MSVYMHVNVVSRCKYVCAACVHTLESGMLLWFPPLNLESRSWIDGFFFFQISLCAGLLHWPSASLYQVVWRMPPTL